MRKTLVAGNWKMHKTLTESLAFANEFKTLVDETPCVIVAPFPFLVSLAEAFRNTPHIKLGAQNCHSEVQGAFTGEVSAEMLKSAGVSYIVIGHSERRAIFGETDAFLAAKTNAVLRAGLKVIFCCGEPLEVREADQHFALVEQQLRDGLFHLQAADFAQVIVAYEPVWAIGTGKTASPAQAQDMHAHIRQLVRTTYGDAVADALIIQYGGSVKPDNAAELFAQPDVDGGLVGGASLKAADFAAIVKA